jgi:hypothetical protein
VTEKKAMQYVYFDESIHDECGFIIGAFVFCDDSPDVAIGDLLNKYGLNSIDSEFKSSGRMDNNPDLAQIRAELFEILQSTNIALLIIPSVQRKFLGDEALKFLPLFVAANDRKLAHVQVFFDEGISVSNKTQADTRKRMAQSLEIFPRQKSHLVRGIQLADLVSHTASVILKQSMLSSQKSVTVGPNNGAYSDREVELGFMLWAQMRYRFLRSKRTQTATEDDLVGNLTYDVLNYGLGVSNHCDESLNVRATDAFGTVYLGCIH